MGFFWQPFGGGASAPNGGSKENQQPPAALAAAQTTGEDDINVTSGLLCELALKPFAKGEEVLYTSKSGNPSLFILDRARVVKAHHDDPYGPYYDIVVITSKPIEKNTLHSKLVGMTDVVPYRADSATIYKGDLIWYKPSDDPNWIGAQVLQGTVKSAHPDGSFSIVPKNGGFAPLKTDISHLVLCQTWPHFRKDQHLIYCPDRKNPSAWTYAVSKGVKIVGSNQYLYAIELFGGSHQCAVWESKLEKAGKDLPLHPDWNTIFKEAGLGTVETRAQAEQIAWNSCRIFGPEHVSHMSFWKQHVNSKTYMYEQLENLAGKKINFLNHDLDCVAGIWRKKDKPILVLDFGTVPDDVMIASANKAIVTMLGSAEKSLNVRKNLTEILAKGLYNLFHTTNSTILWKLLRPFLWSPEKFLIEAKARKDSLAIPGRLPPANSADFGVDDDDEEGFHGGKTNGDDDDDDDDQQPGAGKVVHVGAGAQRPFESPDTISSAESVDFDKLSVDEQRKLFKKTSDTAKKVRRRLAMAEESLQDVTGSLRDVTGSLRDVTGSNRNMSSTIRSQQDLQGTLVAQNREERQEANRRQEEDRLRYEARQEEIDRRREQDRLRYEAQVQAERERLDAKIQAEREHSAAVIREERQAEREHSAALISNERRSFVENLAPLLAPARAPIVDAPAPVASDAAGDKTDSKASATVGDAANTTSAGALPTVTGTSATASALTRSAATPVAMRLNTPARSQFSNAPMAPATILHDTGLAPGASYGGTETGDAVAQGTGPAPPVQVASSEEPGVGHPQQEEQRLQPHLVVANLNDERNAWVVSDDQAISEGDYVVWTPPENPNVAALQNDQFLGPFRVVDLNGRTLTTQTQRLNYEVPGRDKPQRRLKKMVTKVVRRNDQN